MNILQERNLSIPLAASIAAFALAINTGCGKKSEPTATAPPPPTGSRG